MKVAMVGTKGVPAQWGGIERYVEEIGKRLAQRGHEVTVFGSGWFLKDFSGDTYCGMRIRRVPALHYQATDALSNALFSSLLVAREDFDIVNFHGYASYFFVPLLHKLGKKTVVTSHGLVDSEWVNPKYNGFATSIIRCGGAVGIKGSDRVATVSEHWRMRIEQEFGRDATVLSSGIDEAEIMKPDIIYRRYGLSARSYILFLGRIDPIKRIEWVVRLTDVCPQLTIVIAGGAQDATARGYLRKLWRMSQGRRNIIFTGPVTGRVKSELLSNCRIFVNPSQSEGLPVVLLEAISRARCCIASDIPAHREVIEDGRTGFLFPAQDQNAFTEVVSTSASALSSLETMGAEAREKAREKYSWERTALLTENIYSEVMNGLHREQQDTKKAYRPGSVGR